MVLAMTLSLTACFGGKDDAKVEKTKQEESQNEKEKKAEDKKKAKDAKKAEKERKKAEKEKKAAEKKALKEAKNEAIEKISGFEFLDYDQISDFREKINEKENLKDVREIFEEANKTNEEKKKSEVEANKLASLYQPAKVAFIYDGKTIDVELDKEEYKVSLVGIDVGEFDRQESNFGFCGKESYELTKDKLEYRDIYLETALTTRDKDNNLISFIWINLPENPDNPSFEEVRDQTIIGNLLSEGLAKTNADKLDNKYADWMKKIEEEAKAEKKGLWDETKKSVWETSKNSPESKWVRTTAEITNRGKTYTADTTQGPVKGNRSSKKYHVQGQQGYNKISVNNVVWFNTREEAEAAGFVPAKK